jgi:hypothetical protein
MYSLGANAGAVVVGAGVEPARPATLMTVTAKASTASSSTATTAVRHRRRLVERSGLT